MKKTAAFALTLLLATGVQAACYTVLGARGQVLSQASTPPVDMSYQLHQTVPYRYGSGASLVFGLADGNCGPDADPYYDLPLNQAAYREGRAPRARAGLRAARRDRQ